MTNEFAENNKYSKIYELLKNGFTDYLYSIYLPALSQEYNIENIHIDGYIGNRINTCIEHRVKSQNTDHLIEPFKHRNEDHLWQSEFFGKWLLGAIASYQYTKDKELYNLITNSVEKLMNTQTSDGYIGNYKREAQLTNWDIWGRKYTSLSLLSYYRLTGDKKALNAVERLINHLMEQLQIHNINIAATGYYLGMGQLLHFGACGFIYTILPEIPDIYLLPKALFLLSNGKGVLN